MIPISLGNMKNVYISMGLQNIKSCLKGNLEVYDLREGQKLNFVLEKELADVVLTEPNSLYLFTGYPTVVLSDNDELVKEYENCVEAVPFPMSQNDLPPIRRALLR